MTTVKELIEKLQTLPQDLIVLKANDSEGNGYEYIETNYIDTAGFNKADKNYDLEVGVSDKLTPKLEEQGYTEEDIKEFPCVVIA